MPTYPKQVRAGEQEVVVLTHRGAVLSSHTDREKAFSYFERRLGVKLLSKRWTKSMNAWELHDKTGYVGMAWVVGLQTK